MKSKLEVHHWESQKVKIILPPLTPRSPISHGVLVASEKCNSRITKSATEKATGLDRDLQEGRDRLNRFLKKRDDEGGIYNRGLQKQRSVTTTGWSTIWGQLLGNGYSLVLIKQEPGITQWKGQKSSSYRGKDLFILNGFKLAIVAKRCSEVQKKLAL